MKYKELYQIVIDNYFNACLKHTLQVNKQHKGGYTNKNNPFELFHGKLLECVWNQYFLNNKHTCRLVNFTVDGMEHGDGGVDLYIDNQPVSVKLRKLDHSKHAYDDEETQLYHKQYKQATSIINDLIRQDKKCAYIVGGIRYNTELYDKWNTAYDKLDIKLINNISYELLNNMLYFTTYGNNIQIFNELKNNTRIF